MASPQTHVLLPGLTLHCRTSKQTPVEPIMCLCSVICLLFNPGQTLHRLQQRYQNTPETRALPLRSRLWPGRKCARHGGNAGLQGLRSPGQGGLPGLRGSHALSEQTATETSSQAMPAGVMAIWTGSGKSRGGGGGSSSLSSPSRCAAQLSRRCQALGLWLCLRPWKPENTSPPSQTLSLPKAQRSIL